MVEWAGIKRRRERTKQLSRINNASPSPKMMPRETNDVQVRRATSGDRALTCNRTCNAEQISEVSDSGQIVLESHRGGVNFDSCLGR
jgi:hypothetical protein